MKVLVFGISGMLGSTIFKYLSRNEQFEVYGTVRGETAPAIFQDSTRIIKNIDACQFDHLKRAFDTVNPNVVINCIGAIKQLDEGNNPLQAIPLNALLPHMLADLCKQSKARLIHFSTDCVFSGDKGEYREEDTPDAYDVYGRSKLLGEVDYEPALTLRTSIIGHELSGNKSLISWFLSQEGEVKGFARAMYSGLPTIEVAELAERIILEHPDLMGLYHVASNPISKYDLLCKVKDAYGKQINIVKTEDFIVDKTLNADRFNKQISYSPPDWTILVNKMRDFEQG